MKAFGNMYLVIKEQLYNKEKIILEMPYNTKYKIFNIGFLEKQYQLECERIVRYKFTSTIIQISIEPIIKYFNGSKEDFLMIFSDYIQSFRSSDIAGIIPDKAIF